MDIYLVSLLFGGFGLAAMGLMGLGSHSHGGGSAHGGHAGGHDIGHAGHDVGHAGHDAGHGHSHDGHDQAAGPGHISPLWQLMSPRIIFAVLFGVGIVGLALRPVFGGAILLGAAILGGLAAERFVVMPLWNGLMKFGSKPANTLESSLMSEAKVVSTFDVNGNGVVALEVNGEVVQLLAKLSRDSIDIDRRLRAGDLVRVEEIDAARNRCVVSRI